MPSLHPTRPIRSLGFAGLILLAPHWALAPAAAKTASPTAAGTVARPSADPLDAGAAVPPAAYRSILQQPPAPPRPAMAWREANEQVLRNGGWRAYLREAAQARATEQAQAAAAAASAAAEAAPAVPGTTPAPPPAAAAPVDPHAHHRH